MPELRFFLSVFFHIWIEYRDVQSKSPIAGKCGPEKTTNLATLHAVKVLGKIVNNTPAGNDMFKANNRNTRTRCEMC